jgi:hypothetical protein
MNLAIQVLLILLVSLSFEYKSLAQNIFNPRYLAGIHSESGPIMKHTINFRPNTDRWVQSLSFFIEKKTTQTWSSDNSSLRWNLHWMHFGNPEVLGQAISLYPSVIIPLYRQGNGVLRAHIGSGFSAITRKYHPVNNPENNAIGSTINNITQIGLGWNWQTRAGWNLEGGLNFTHYSNGSFQNPNLGINAFCAGISIARPIGKTKSHVYKDTLHLPQTLARRYFSLRKGLAVQSNVPGGPQHLAFSLASSYMVKTGRRNATGAGLHLGYNNGEYRWQLRRLPESTQSLHLSSSDVAIHAVNEWYVANISLVTMAGFYVYDPFFKIAPVFIKLGFHYYPFKTPGSLKDMFFFGSIKSHFFIADYMEFGLGYRFRT